MDVYYSSGGAQLGYQQISFYNISFTEVYGISFERVVVCDYMCMDYNHGAVCCSVTEVDGSCIYILSDVICGMHWELNQCKGGPGMKYKQNLGLSMVHPVHHLSVFAHTLSYYVCIKHMWAS